MLFYLFFNLKQFHKLFLKTLMKRNFKENKRRKRVKVIIYLPKYYHVNVLRARRIHSKVPKNN